MNYCEKNFYPNCEKTFQEIKRLIESYQKIIILGHIYPDVDCVGGQLALLQFLQTEYPQKWIRAPFASDDQRFQFLLPKNYENVIEEEDQRGALVIVVDTATRKRIPFKIIESNTVIQIDHHPDGEKFGDVVWIDKESIAVCEMIYFLLSFWKKTLKQEVANALLAGIISDSGRFQYKKTQARTFWVTYQLIELGADLIQINKHIQQQSANDLLTMQWILNHYYKKAKFVFVKFVPQDKKQLPSVKKREDVKKFINIFDNTEGVNVWATFVQLENDEPVFISIRSKKHAINQVAKAYGGGGHANAAAIKLKDWTMVAEIIEELTEISKDD